MTTLMWFREDLRLADSPALAWAAQQGAVVGVVVDEDPAVTGHRPWGAASRWWWERSTTALQDSLAGYGVPLVRTAGDPRRLIVDLAARCGAGNVVWARRHDAPLVATDDAVHRALVDAGHRVETFPGHLLTEPGEVSTAAGGGYKVFTPFSRAASPVAQEHTERLIDHGIRAPVDLHGPENPPDLLNFRHRPAPDRPTSDHPLDAVWAPGEASALAALESFVTTGAGDYGRDRDRPALDATSRLSPHLRFGEVSPHRVWYATGDADTFRTELLWRDFAWHRFHDHPDMGVRSIRPEFAGFNWQWDPPAGVLDAWRHGETGIPLVDAGMRELSATGYMHNRVRMVVASFLTKNLLVHWRRGEEWFWDTLVDADPASNAFNWQWAAGCADDASPYFRIFNPVTQQKRFDPDLEYVHRWVPEEGTGDYPPPVVDLRESREAALDTYNHMRATRG